MSAFSLTAYLDRIRFSGGTEPNYDTLYKLHTGHTFNIPFENLDVANKLPISLALDALFDKLVTRNRGGYCFEMNGLFSHVLQTVGFAVTPLLARTAFAPGKYSAKLHEVLLVEFEGSRYLADVGYGNNGIAAPLPLVTRQEHKQFADTYRFQLDADAGYILERKEGAYWLPMYAFTTEPCIPEDYEVSNHYTATHPSSFFRMAKFATMPTPEGRITLMGGTFKTVANGETTEIAVSSDEEFDKILLERFNLKIS
ncbi:MAG: arylamine N-acetyltransferase [Oscillospiraceae bacterium]|jgi:N-hydroxyarylamine O-acetyltransferase|nr:arylamine N-acetyltransferase [Oscillospiraceae bacterium]